MKRGIDLTLSEEEGLKDLGYAIQLARRRRSISQDELALRTGSSRATIARLEKGDPGTSVGLLHKVFTSFGYDDILPRALESDPIGDDQMFAHGRGHGKRSR